MRKLVPWFPALICAIITLLIWVLFPSIRFTAYIFLGLTALLACFRILKLLEAHSLHTAKLLRRILCVCLCIGLLITAVTGFLVLEGSLGDTDAECEYIVVLGCGVNGTVPSLLLRERIDAAYEYLAAHPDTICVVSGGQGPGEDITEAACMFRELTTLGIEPDRIWLEDRSTSTEENLAFSLSIIEQRTGSRPSHIGIVSGEYHLYRAGLMAGEYGLTSSGIPAETAWVPLRINYYLREIAAVWYYLLGRIFV